MAPPTSITDAVIRTCTPLLPGGQSSRRASELRGAHNHASNAPSKLGQHRKDCRDRTLPAGKNRRSFAAHLAAHDRSMPGTATYSPRTPSLPSALADF